MKETSVRLFLLGFIGDLMMMNAHVLLAVDFGVLVNDLFAPPKIPTDPAPLALQELWLVAMNGNLYKLVTSIGILIAIFAVGFWCFKFYLAIEEGGLRPAYREMIFPAILVILLSNGGGNMRNLTLAGRDIMNNVNSSVNSVIDADVSIRSAAQTLNDNFVAQSIIGGLYRSCMASADLNKMKSCADATRVQINAVTGGAAPALQVSGNVKYQEQLTKFAEKMKARNEARYKQVVDTASGESQKKETDGVIENGEGGKPNSSISVLDPTYFENDQALEGITKTIMSFRVGFIYVVEIMMIITGLVGPIFLGLSLFPVGTKPLIAWGTSFLSLGFCKICYTLISGLSSIAFVYAGPDNIDASTVAVVLGILSPVLAFSIASSSGINALNSAIGPAQVGGINFGLGYSSPNNNQKG
jgi:hypothetical protein